MIKRAFITIAVIIACAIPLLSPSLSMTSKAILALLAALVIAAIWRRSAPKGETPSRTLTVCNPVEGKVYETHSDMSYGISGQKATMDGFHVYFTEGEVKSPVEGTLTFRERGQAQIMTASGILVVVQCPFEPTTYEPSSDVRVGEHVNVGTRLMRVSWDSQAQVHVASVMLEHMGVGLDVLVNKGTATLRDTKGVVAAGKPVMTVTLGERA